MGLSSEAVGGFSAGKCGSGVFCDRLSPLLSEKTRCLLSARGTDVSQRYGRSRRDMSSALVHNRRRPQSGRVMSLEIS
jgi:hypothetical protein